MSQHEDLTPRATNEVRVALISGLISTIGSGRRET